MNRNKGLSKSLLICQNVFVFPFLATQFYDPKSVMSFQMVLFTAGTQAINESARITLPPSTRYTCLFPSTSFTETSFIFQPSALCFCFL